MGIVFWLRRFLWVFCIAFVVLVSVHLLRGQAPVYSLKESLLWAMISTCVFIATRIYRSRKGQHCVLCNDVPASK